MDATTSSIAVLSKTGFGKHNAIKMMPVRRWQRKWSNAEQSVIIVALTMKTAEILGFLNLRCNDDDDQ